MPASQESSLPLLRALRLGRSFSHTRQKEYFHTGFDGDGGPFSFWKEASNKQLYAFKYISYAVSSVTLGFHRTGSSS